MNRRINSKPNINRIIWVKQLCSNNQQVLLTNVFHSIYCLLCCIEMLFILHLSLLDSYSCFLLTIQNCSAAAWTQSQKDRCFITRHTPSSRRAAAPRNGATTAVCVVQDTTFWLADRWEWGDLIGVYSIFYCEKQKDDVRRQNFVQRNKLIVVLNLYSTLTGTRHSTVSGRATSTRSRTQKIKCLKSAKPIFYFVYFWKTGPQRTSAPSERRLWMEAITGFISQGILAGLVVAWFDWGGVRFNHYVSNQARWLVWLSG